MVNGKVALLKYRCQLKLVRCHLVVACLAGNAKFQSLYLQFFHEGSDTLGDAPEVVVVHLLVLGAVVPHECTSRQHEVWACRV